MYLAVSEKNLTIFGIGETIHSAIKDVEENCVHPWHPLVKKEDVALLLKVENNAEYPILEIKEFIDDFEVSIDSNQQNPSTCNIHKQGSS